MAETGMAWGVGVPLAATVPHPSQVEQLVWELAW